MTCKDFHHHWERRVGASTDLLSQSPEMAEHARACSECNGLVADEHLVEGQLELVRSAAPNIPASLDAAVEGNYRRYRAELAVAIDRPRWRAAFENALPWAAALAFAAMVGYAAILFFLPHVSSGRTNGGDRTPARQSPVALRTEAQVSPRVPPIRKAQDRGRRAPNHGANIEAAAPREDSFPRAFQSLVYCDQISCPGALEVIRVQLPAPVLGLDETPARAGGMVSADVLVGADGIARGIRVAE